MRTLRPGWDVHDVVGHVLNDYMRCLFGGRDGYGGAVFADDETLRPASGAYQRGVRPGVPAAQLQLMIELLDHPGPRLDAVWAVRDLVIAAHLNAPGPSPTTVAVSGATEPNLMAPVLDGERRPGIHPRAGDHLFSPISPGWLWG
ncbi:hypothetical protein [Actinoallomurus sp. CA-142502]|uniref:hypothetical protein n=1 Tax=Actinoallomurus sp. CA-142502 TaxID=3239885 RepID=UPI003D90AF88